MDPHYTSNLLGALALALVDKTATALEGALGAGGNAVPALLTIGTRPDRSVDQLARVLRLSHSTTVRIVDRLEDGGWVRRMRATDDSRSVLLRLTRAGRGAFRRLLAAREEALSHVTDVLTERERDVLRRLVSKMLASLPTTREDAFHICRLCEHAICHGEDCPVGHAVTVRSR